MKRYGAAKAALAAILLLSGTQACSAEPRSAIPWLSQSIKDPPPLPRQDPRQIVSDPAQTELEIIVTPLDAVRRDAVGLLPPDRTGLTRALWGPASALRVRNLILDHPDRGVPEARALFRRLLLAETDPPAGSGPASTILLARLDRLMEMGALNEAEALLERAGPDTPELFRRWFDVAILLERAEKPCEALRSNPGLSPTLPARVFCLARGGDWNAAEITLTLGRDVGEVSEAQELTLARFLDPVMFEDSPDPPVPEPLTALDFVLREAVGLPRPPGTLPLAFLTRDLADYAPMRTRIMSAERLVLSGAATAEVLFDAYRAGEPAASGGFWDRAAAVQKLDAALTAGDLVALPAALGTADTLLSDRGLRAVFATHYSEALAVLDPATLPDPVQGTLLELLLIGGADDAAERAAGPAPEARAAILLAIAGIRPGLDPSSLVNASPLQRAAIRGLTAVLPEDPREERLLSMLDEGRQGEAILAALDLLGAGTRVDPPALQAALLTLRRAGLERTARRIAIQTLLLPDESGQ